MSPSCDALSDISDKALRLPLGKCEKNEVQVEIVQGDFLLLLPAARADVIFCNPPYISPKEYLALDRSVKDFEPEDGLGRRRGWLRLFIGD